jgi:hypothetical protein
MHWSSTPPTHGVRAWFGLAYAHTCRTWRGAGDAAVKGVPEGWGTAPSSASCGQGRWPAILSMPGPCPCVNPGSDVQDASLSHHVLVHFGHSGASQTISNRCPLCVCLPSTSLGSAFQVLHVVCLPAEHLQCTCLHASLLFSCVLLSHACPEVHWVRPLHGSGILCAGPVPVLQGALSTLPSSLHVPERGPSARAASQPSPPGPCGGPGVRADAYR